MGIRNLRKNNNKIHWKEYKQNDFYQPPPISQEHLHLKKQNKNVNKQKPMWLSYLLLMA